MIDLALALLAVLYAYVLAQILTRRFSWSFAAELVFLDVNIIVATLLIYVAAVSSNPVTLALVIIDELLFSLLGIHGFVRLVRELRAIKQEVRE
jgi:type III secretory pathway component EscR